MVKLMIVGHVLDQQSYANAYWLLEQCPLALRDSSVCP